MGSGTHQRRHRSCLTQDPGQPCASGPASLQLDPPCFRSCSHSWIHSWIWTRASSCRCWARLWRMVELKSNLGGGGVGLAAVRHPLVWLGRWPSAWPASPFRPLRVWCCAFFWCCFLLVFVGAFVCACLCLLRGVGWEVVAGGSQGGGGGGGGGGE